MIIASIRGGLGNQMFQYAMAKSLALDIGVELKLDLTWYKNSDRPYRLDCFNITESSAEIKEIRGYKNLAGDSILHRIVNRLAKVRKSTLLEQSLGFDKRYKLVKAPAYLEGYWQNERYFSGHISAIRNNFQFKEKLKFTTLDVRSHLGETKVSIHIRRGDYVQYEHINKIHGTCTIEYYAAAIEKICNLVKNPIFFIFSDDILWCEQNLHIDFPHYFITNEGLYSDIKDLWMMSLCNHHIIANSSFSWWGAWLNSSEEKIVIAPKRWFADDEKNKEAVGIVPQTWFKI